MPPAIEAKAGADNLALDDDARAFERAEIVARQENLADENLPLARLVAGVLDDFAEERLRRLDQDAGAVAGLAVGVHSAAVPH